MLNKLFRQACGSSVRKPTVRSITKNKADAFAVALKKPAQRAFLAEDESDARQQANKAISCTTEKTSDERSIKWVSAAEEDKALASEKLDRAPPGERDDVVSDEHSAKWINDLEKHLTLSSVKSDCTSSNKLDNVVQEIAPPCVGLPNGNLAINILGSKSSAQRNNTASLERVIQLTELSNFLHQVDGLATTQTSQSRAQGLLSHSNFSKSQHPQLVPESQGMGRWTLEIQGNTLGLKSMQLQLTAQGAWNIVLDVHARTVMRPSNRSLCDLQAELVRRGHRINEVRVSELSGDADNAND